MSLALHAHQILIIATLTFLVAVLTPNWYSSPKHGLKINIFQICTGKSNAERCAWTFSGYVGNPAFEASNATDF